MLEWRECKCLESDHIKDVYNYKTLMIEHLGERKI